MAALQKKMPAGAPHPREYIHGAIFLFREPREAAALSYELRCVVVWNVGLVTDAVAQKVHAALLDVVPQVPLSGRGNHSSK